MFGFSEVSIAHVGNAAVVSSNPPRNTKDKKTYLYVDRCLVTSGTEAVRVRNPWNNQKSRNGPLSLNHFKSLRSRVY